MYQLFRQISGEWKRGTIYEVYNSKFEFVSQNLNAIIEQSTIQIVIFNSKILYIKKAVGNSNIVKSSPQSA